MDIVTDLSSQAVTFITVYQGIFQGSKNNTRSLRLNASIDKILDTEDQNLSAEQSKLDQSKKRIGEIMGINDPDLVTKAHLHRFLKACEDVLDWVVACELLEGIKKLKVDKKIDSCNLFSSAYEWRCCIRAILYADTQQREVLARKLEYMPIQIVFCLDDKDDLSYRLRQAWIVPGELNQLSGDEQKLVKDWWDQSWDTKENKPCERSQSFMFLRKDKPITEENMLKPRIVVALQLLRDDHQLSQLLDIREVAVPFETIFNSELDEIRESREVREHIDNCSDSNLVESLYSHANDATRANRKSNIRAGDLWGSANSRSELKDPIERAADMDMYGLTFSGGGIRSATFNLGVLQALSELGLISRFDYISTVSGGGYVGSWLASWIKRSGSISRVADRLNPKKSSDPLADEVRPIRWLRMFSNYLSPNASIMSADAWTVGITWLRNTVINQIILLLLLCTALSVIGSIYYVWGVVEGKLTEILWWTVLWRSFLILMAGAVIAGFGMRVFDPAKRLPGSGIVQKSLNDRFYILLMAWGAITTFFISAWLYKYADMNYPVSSMMVALSAAGISGFISFITVALIGRYNSCVPAANRDGWFYFWLTVSSLCAAGCGILLLTGSWLIFVNITAVQLNLRGIPNICDRLAFIFGVPMMLESISIMVVVRMAILGVLFPDLRREWWGRMGAIVHRFIFLWILVAVAALILKGLVVDLIIPHLSTKVLLAMVGGWSGIIAYAVKLASNSKTAGDKPATSNTAAVTDIFVRLAPYLFAFGFLLLGSFVLENIKEIWPDDALWQYVWVPIGLGAITLFLSLRVGVNEFSLHHFYRNRLTRAYLGATLRREVWEKTANSFTKFDEKDDMPLKDLVTTQNYFGPYPVINTTLNSSVVTDLDRQDRKGESFVFTPRYCGYDVCRTRPSANSLASAYEYGYRPTNEYAYPGTGPSLATAMTISGAALSPNQGYHSSSATAFLMTLFNARLGWWMGNPREKDAWKKSDPDFGIAYLVYDLIGETNINDDFVCLSDGGHFDNMGLYEMIRRRCRLIMVCDAEEDQKSTCEGLANAIRRCRIDFGVEIQLSLDPILNLIPQTKFVKQHWVEGDIWYPGDKEDEPSGTIIYLKTSVTGNESVDIREYFMNNTEFPQQSTADQFFDEQQFESYRQLGYSSIIA